MVGKDCSLSSGQKWEKRGQTCGSSKNLKVCRITNVCTHAKRLLKPSCPSATMDVISK